MAKKTPLKMPELLQQSQVSIDNIQSAYNSAHNAYHNYNDWEKEQWDRIESSIQAAKKSITDSINQTIENCAKVCGEESTVDGAVAAIKKLKIKG